jgi:DMATS type aromatic prenyltransferase
MKLHAVAPDQQLASLGAAQLQRLVNAVGLGHRAAAIDELFNNLIAPYCRRPIAAGPASRSDIADDHTPYEFSIAFGDTPHLRVLFEAQGRGDLMSNRDEARALNERIARAYGLSLARYRAVEELYFPTQPQGRFALWHAIELNEEGPDFKIYLNPQARGADAAPAVVEETLARLGFTRGFLPFITHATPRGPRFDQLRYISLDLHDKPCARLKVYVFHRDSTVEDLERAASAARDHVPGEVAEFCRAMTGTSGVYRGLSVATCYSWMNGDDARPSSSTLHLPIRSYVEHDREARDRVRDYLARRKLPTAQFDTAIAAHASRPLESGVGLISYASLRRGGRVTMYLSAEAYRVEPARPPRPLALPPLPPLAEIVHQHEREPLTLHPFFARLRRERVSLAHLWALFSNIRFGLSRHFPRRLASVVARIDDERVRSILAKQLNEELGDGDYTKAHLLLMNDLVNGLARYRPAGVGDEHLAPGRELEERLEAPYADPEPYVGLGAAILIELYGKQVDRYIGDEFRRQREVAGDVLTWLTLHETLELEHADESLALCGLVPADKADAVWRGARAIYDLSWRFFDRMYELCWP